MSVASKLRRYRVRWIGLAAVMSMAVAVGVSSPAAAGSTTYQYSFEFVNGTTLAGSAQDKTAFLAGAGGSSVENPTGMEVHLSCSDKFEGGWGQKDGPEQGVDTAWQLTSYSIQKIKDGKIDKSCSDNFGPPTPVGIPAIDIEKFVNGQDADDPTGPVVNVGDTVTFDYVVTNTGEVPLTSVAAVDLTLGPISCPSTTLAVGESMDCSPNSEVVTTPGQMFMEAEVTAIGATGAPGITDPIPGNGKGRLYSFSFVNGTTISGSAPDDNTFFLPNAGGTSVSSPTGMEVHLSCSDKFEGGWGEKDGPEQGVDTAWQLAAYQIIKYKDGKIDKQCGDSFFPVTQEVSDSDPVYFLAVVPANPMIDIEKSVNGEDADNPPGPTVQVGDTVTFGYVVTNTGDVPLTGVSVVDSTLGPVSCPKDTLAVGETMACGPNTEVPHQPGPMSMKATATGTGAGTPVMDMDPVNFLVIPKVSNPAIDVEKYVNGYDADEAPGPSFDVGDTVTFTYVVMNTGDVPLTGVSVVDSTLGPVNCPKTTLAVGEAMVCDPHSDVVTHPGPMFMKATATGIGGGTLVMDMDPVNFVVVKKVEHPDVDIEKYVNGHDSDYPPGLKVYVGDEVRFDYLVTNTGDTVLNDIVVVDDTLGLRTCPKTTLQPGESMWCTPATIIAEHPEYVAMYSTVTGISPRGTVVDDTDPVKFYIVERRW